VDDSLQKKQSPSRLREVKILISTMHQYITILLEINSASFIFVNLFSQSSNTSTRALREKNVSHLLNEEEIMLDLEILTLT
jgi:hypothetical protein